VQSLGLFVYSLLKCLKRFIVLLPDAAVWVAEDLRTRAGLSLSYDAIASRREYGLRDGQSILFFLSLSLSLSLRRFTINSPKN
jgi:hypothetical protein